MGEASSSVQPVHEKAKDTFFKKIFESPVRLKGLAEFLLGCEADSVKIKNIRPVLFGNKENDLAFACDDVVYVMMEEQSKVCLNLPFRITEYIVVALRDSVDTGKLLYGTKRVMFPFPKLYGVNVGIVRVSRELPKSVIYEMRLSDSYENAEKYMSEYVLPDLETIVHIYDFRMTRGELWTYLESGVLPDRFGGFEGDLLDYAITANALTYVQRALKKADVENYPLPSKINSPADLFTLLMTRGVFVDLFEDKEVCDMTVAQFSRDEMLLYQGREEGLEEGLEQGIRLTKCVINMDKDGYDVNEIAVKLHISEEDVRKILE